MAKALRKDKTTQKMPQPKLESAIATTDKGKAEILADSLEQQFKPNPASNPSLEQEVKTTLTGLQYTADIENTPQATTTHITEIIKSLHQRKAPGRYGITNLTVKHLTSDAIKRIAQIANAMFQHRYFGKY